MLFWIQLVVLFWKSVYLAVTEAGFYLVCRNNFMTCLENIYI